MRACVLSSFIRLVIVGGDVLLPEMLIEMRSWSKRGVRIINAYGPTESTVTTIYEIPEEFSGVLVPKGRPVFGRTIYILDKNIQLVPIGVPGELHIGGAGLARGYLNRPELTKEKFIRNLFNNDPCSRLYKTGDLVRYLNSLMAATLPA